MAHSWSEPGLTLLCLQAMVAVFGYGAQAVITHQGPWANLQAHLADPFNNNILTK